MTSRAGGVRRDAPTHDARRTALDRDAMAGVDWGDALCRQRTIRSRSPSIRSEIQGRSETQGDVLMTIQGGTPRAPTTDRSPFSE